MDECKKKEQMYIGVQFVHAEEDYSRAAAGYRVRYKDGGIFWAPKEGFEEIFRPVDGMSFGMAIEAAKLGKRIARKGWNGKGMYVFLADEVAFHTDADISEFEDTGVPVLNCLCMRTADRSICPGWLASQADMLADDWVIVEDTTGMSWSQAEEAIKAGKAVRRRCAEWDGVNFVAELEEPMELRGKTCMVMHSGNISPDWEPDSVDLVADDWCIVED